MSVLRQTCHQDRFPRPRRGQHGFTLIELMVTIAVVAILATMAVPGMVTLMNSNRLTGMAGELTASLQLARSEAIRRNARVTVCSSADGTTCANDPSWNRWIVIGRDNAASAGGAEVIDVIRDDAVAGDVQLRGPAGGIQFNPSGLINAQQALTVCIPTDRPAENQRVITVLISGSVLTSRNNGGGACPS